MRFRHRIHREAGFTLIEILVAMTIIAILAAILIGNFLRTQAQAKVAASKGNIKNLAVALEAYSTEANGYPNTLTALVPAYARGLPLDPCTKSAYAYDTSMSGSPPTDYKLSVTFPLTNACRIISPGISYTPGGGISESP